VTVWERWSAHIARAEPTLPSIRGQLLALAPEVARTVPRRGPIAAVWGRAGIEVRPRPMRLMGRCRTDGSRVVFVRDSDSYPTQRSTVAHELGHLLLGTLPDAHRAAIPHVKEEHLCNDFACAVVVPKGELVERLGGARLPTPDDVLDLCGEFVASPRQMLAAVKRDVALGSSAYVVARKRGHYRRPDATDFRLDGAVGPPRLFWPPDQRLRTMGLVQLADAAHRAARGASFRGRDERAVVSLVRRDERSGDNAVAGPVDWMAVVQGMSTPYVLARLDCSELRLTTLRAPRVESRARHMAGGETAFAA
jgi:hypothetical protein